MRNSAVFELHAPNVIVLYSCSPQVFSGVHVAQ